MYILAPERLGLGQGTAEIDVNRAVHLNRGYAQTLEWKSYIDRIVKLLGFTEFTPNEQLFAEAVAKWQGNQGLKTDGIVGPNTWLRLKATIEHQQPSTTPTPVSLPSFSQPLKYGVPGGRITSGFLQCRDMVGRSYPNNQCKPESPQESERRFHGGIDVSVRLPPDIKGGGADDPRRGLPVYATVKKMISIEELNQAPALSNSLSRKIIRLGIPGQGTAILQNVYVRIPRGLTQSYAYGAVLGLECEYTYTKADGSPGRFVLYIQYLHLIDVANGFPPMYTANGKRKVMSNEEWNSTGKGDRTGFGPQMKDKAKLKADLVTAGPPLLIGFLGAHRAPHVHIQASYWPEGRSSRAKKFDPTVMIY